MRVLCKECGRVHEVLDARVPVFGARLRCAGCGHIVELPAPGTADEREESRSPLPVHVPPPDGEPEGELKGEPEGEPQGRSNGDGTPAPTSRPVEPDPERDADARQLARSLIADIAYADQARLRKARAAGTVLTVFQAPIAQAWAFYCDRVGTSFARQSPHFRQAVQDLLGGDVDE